MLLLKHTPQTATPGTLSTRGFGIVTDLGQAKPNDNTDSPTGLTTDELEWARELGASTLDEAVDLVRKHEESKR